jgi:HNH endonuclease
MPNAKNNDIPIAFLVSCFIVDPTAPSGLRWRHRQREHFASESSRKTWNAVWPGKPAGTLGKRYFKVILTIEGRERQVGAHRIACAITKGEWPSDQVDHEDRTKSNNKIENLRDTYDEVAYV